MGKRRPWIGDEPGRGGNVRGIAYDVSYRQLARYTQTPFLPATMRSALALVAALAALNCGPPEVEVPAGNDNPTSDPVQGQNADLPPPTVENVPKSYPFSRLALRGTATNAVRV